VRRFALIALAGCGRLDFAITDGQVPTAACWSGSINVSENVGRSYAPSLASDGTALYLAWTDTTGYIDDWTTGTDNIFFRRVELDGSLVAPVIDIPKSALGTNRNWYPNLLAKDGALAMAYSAQGGTSIDSDGQARFVHLDTTGSALSTSVLLSTDIVSPTPGITAVGLAHDLAYDATSNQFLFSVHGKYPWGGVGAWNRSAYFLDAVTGTRVGARACFNNCPTVQRIGHSQGDGRAIYRPPPDDWVAFFEPDQPQQSGLVWNVTFRRIGRDDTQVGTDVVADMLTVASTMESPHVDFAWSDSLTSYVAVWAGFSQPNYDVRTARLDANGVVQAMTTLGSVPSETVSVRMLPLASSGYFVLVSTLATQYMLELDANGAVAVPLTAVVDAQRLYDSMIEQNGRVIVATADPTSGEVLLDCLKP
jgi:hypothetical protein